MTDFGVTHARVMLRDLDNCQRIDFQPLGPDLEVCGHDFVPVIATRDGWRHDARFIARLRETAMEGVWPNG